MEDYQYTNGSGRSSSRYQPWGTSGNGYQAMEGWNSGSSALKFSGGGMAEAPHDHVCRPVIVGSDGRVMPAVLECPPRYNNYTDGYGSNGFAGVGGNARWDYSGDSYAFEKRGKNKNFLDHVHDATMSGYGLDVTGSGFQRHKADYGSYDAGAAGGVYGTSANGWGKTSVGAASHGMPLEKAANYIIETAVESLLDSKRPAASAYSGGGWESWNSSHGKNKKNGLVSSIGKDAAKKYAGQFIW